MNFVRKVSETDTSQDVIVGAFSNEEKLHIIEWLRTTLQIDQFSDSNHPLIGVIEVSTALTDVEDVHAAIEKFGGEETELSFTPKEFIVLTEIARMWKMGDDRSVIDLDAHVKANKTLFDQDQRVKIRDYVLSDAFKNEIKVFDDVVTSFKDAYASVYPEDGN
jgi:hypothetical protein